MFTLALTLLVIGAGIALFSSSTARAVGAGVALLGLALVVASVFTTVPAQNVGVLTTFGKPTGRSLSPGLHAKIPWQKETDMDGTVQKLDNQGGARTAVRLNSNSVMYVDNAFRWKIRPSEAPLLYLDWRKGDGNIVEDHIASGLVNNELAAALNVDLADYDPYDRAKAGQSNDELAQAVSLRLFGADGRSGRIGAEIEEVSFTILSVNFDDQTQARLDAINQQKAATQQAAEARLTAAQQAAANKTLASSVSKDPNVLVSKCLDGQIAAEAKGANLTGWPSCWPGTASSGTLVTVPSK